MGGGLFSSLAWSLLQGLMVLTGYVRNQRSFPEPLSREEEKECLKRMEEGDEAAQDKLVRHNLRLVAHIVKKFDNTGEEQEDLISIGTLGLIKGIQTFDRSKGTRLATYAARCIENEILMHLRSTRRGRRNKHLEDPIGTDGEGNEISLLDVMEAGEEDIVERVGRNFDFDRLREHMKELTHREQLVILGRYGLHDGVRRTQREIAKELDISRSYVSRIEKRAINKLAELFAQEE